jgi:hypothetical protein
MLTVSVKQYHTENVRHDHMTLRDRWTENIKQRERETDQKKNLKNNTLVSEVHVSCLNIVTLL